MSLPSIDGLAFEFLINISKWNNFGGTYPCYIF